MARYSKRFAANAIVSGCVVCCYVCVCVFVGECVRQSYWYGHCCVNRRRINKNTADIEANGRHRSMRLIFFSTVIIIIVIVLLDPVCGSLW